MSSIKEEFDRNFELDKQINKTYIEVMEIVKNLYKPNQTKFSAETGLGKTTYYNILGGYTKPLMTSIDIFCILYLKLLKKC